MKSLVNLVALILSPLAVSAADGKNGKTLIRVGHFPNITDAQGFIAHNLSRQGKVAFTRPNAASLCRLSNNSKM
jgi:hypothetical protein